MMTISMSYNKFTLIDDSINYLCEIARYQSHSDLFNKIKNMDDRELVHLAATINELAYEWNKLKGIRE